MLHRHMITFIFGSFFIAAPLWAQDRFSPDGSPGLFDLQLSLLPYAPQQQLGASEIYQALADKNVLEREELAVALFERGHFPQRLRSLKPVTLTQDGHEVTFWVMPDYLALGTDKDAMLMPLSYKNTLRILRAWDFVLPTKKMVNAIFEHAERTIWPKTYPAGPDMNSMQRIREHSDWIEGQRYLSSRQDLLTAGHKKDIVMTRRLYRHDDRIAIYGWQNIRSGEPMQPLSIWHGDRYVDYSHGIRLVAPWVIVDGALMPIKQLLMDQRLSSLLSDEGPLDADRILRNPAQSIAHNN